MTFDKIVYNVYSDNEEDFWEAYEKTQGYPITQMFLKSSSGHDLIGHERDEGIVHASSMLLTNRTGHIDLKVIVPGQGHCRRPTEKLFINWNGDYILCCEDWSDTPLSNINKESIGDYYYYNVKLQKKKDELNNGYRNGVCSKCSFPG